MMNSTYKEMKAGFTLIELMVVVAIIAFLSMISIPSLTKFLAKAKRSEAYVNLGSLAMAQKAYWAEHGTYATALNGPDSLNWKPQGNFQYTYGFATGTNGVNHFIGKLGTAASALTGSQISPDGFKIYAAGDIDGDGEPDILSVDENSVITLVKDDLS